jgi:hypothetical protein
LVDRSFDRINSFGERPASRNDLLERFLCDEGCSLRSTVCFDTKSLGRRLSDRVIRFGYVLSRENDWLEHLHFDKSCSFRLTSCVEMVMPSKTMPLKIS